MSLPLKDFRCGIDELTDIALTAAAEGSGREKAEIGREVLHEWASRKAHEHSVFARLLSAKGLKAEEDGTGGDTDGVPRIHHGTRR